MKAQVRDMAEIAVLCILRVGEGSRSSQGSRLFAGKAEAAKARDLEVPFEDALWRRQASAPRPRAPRSGRPPGAQPTR